MKKILVLIWFTFSTLLAGIGICKSPDELLSRRELLTIAVPVLVLSVLFSFFLMRISLDQYLTALFAAVIPSIILCLWMEINHPVILIPPSETTLQITAAPDSPVTLDWAYWSRPNRDVNDAVNDWHPIREIPNSMLTYEGNWEKAERNMLCTGQCTLRLKKDLRFNRPVFSFISAPGSMIRNQEEIHTSIDGSGLLFFAEGKGLSRQLVFIILFFIFCGLFTFPASLFAVFQKNDPDKDITRSSHNLILFIASFLIPVIIVSFISLLLKMWPFGEKTFLITDMQVQYADYLIYFKQVLQGKHSLLYSFSKSIGDDFLGLYAYYLGNPLNWITALFPIRSFPQAISIIVIVRYGLCGLTAAVFFRKVFGTQRETLIFSTSYALISLQFVIGEHIQLRDGAILLPLVLFGIERMICRGSTALYIVSLCSALLISYYSAYQICLFCVLYFLFRTIMDHKLTRQNISRFIGSSLLSAALCAFFLIPVAIQLTKGMKTFDISQFTFTANMRFSELAGKLFNSSFDIDQTLTSGFPNIFCGLFVTTGIPLYFFNRNIQKREKMLTFVMLAVFIAVMQIRALNLIMHGFNEPVWWPYRYSFIICLFLITMSIRCYQERSGITIYAWGFSLLIILGMLIFIHMQHFNWFTDDAFYLNLVLTAAMFILWTIKPYRFFTLLLVFCGLDLFLNGWMILGEKSAYQRSETSSDFEQFFNNSLQVLSELNDFDKGFYRTEKTYERDANDAMTLGYNGVGHYSSTLNFSLMRFLPKMGYRYYPWRFLYGEGSDLAADSLLGIRYLISDRPVIQKPYEKVFTENGLTVFKNPLSLPIAFSGKNILPTSSNLMTFELQNRIFTELTGRDTPIYIRAQISDPVYQNIRVSEETENLYERIQPEKEASITWSIFPESEGMLYLYLSSVSEDIYPAEIYLDDKYLADCFDGRGSPIIPVTESAAGMEHQFKLVLKEGLIRFDELQLYSEDVTVLKQYAEELTDSSLSLQKNSDTRLSGEILASEDGYILFTIPYDKGWTLIIDDKQADTEKAFDIFLSAPVSEGRHTFTLRYLPEGLKSGCLISGSAVLLLSILTFQAYKKRKRIL